MDAQGICFRVEGCNRCLCRRVNGPGINYPDSSYLLVAHAVCVPGEHQVARAGIDHFPHRLPVVAMHDAHPFTRQSDCVRTGDVYAG